MGENYRPWPWVGWGGLKNYHTKAWVGWSWVIIFSGWSWVGWGGVKNYHPSSWVGWSWVKNILGDHGWGGVKTNFFTPPNGWVNLGLLLLITVFRQKKWILQNLIFSYFWLYKKTEAFGQIFFLWKYKSKKKKNFPREISLSAKFDFSSVKWLHRTQRRVEHARHYNLSCASP